MGVDSFDVSKCTHSSCESTQVPPATKLKAVKVHLMKASDPAKIVAFDEELARKSAT